jgi:aspartyl-tRNA(Asn)/glutamyl-tRNA(Gln) amidotransferase subunit B
MEEGSLRCDANISVRPVGTSGLGIKVEIKNINSFRFLQRALDYEFLRQVTLLRNGGVVVQETRLWNDVSGRTATMRSKEEAHDYRYFPEPDLPPLNIPETWSSEIRASLPELPEERKWRFVEDYKLPEYDVALLTQSVDLADYFEQVAQASGYAKASSNWIMGEVARKMKELGVKIGEIRIRPEALAGLIKLVESETISGSAAKLVFNQMYESGKSAEQIVKAEGLSQIDDEDQISSLVSEAIASHTQVVSSYRAGKTGVLGFLVGQVMRKTKGKANPKLVNRLVKCALDSASAIDTDESAQLD